MQRQIVSSPRKKFDETSELPLYNKRNGNPTREREFSRSRWLVHLIPLIVLICLLILWWWSYPVNLEIKNGRIIAIHRIEIPGSVNETRVDLTILALTLPPYPPIRLIQSLNNDTAAAEPVSIVTD